MRAVVLIPAYNEAPRVLDAVRAAKRTQGVDEVVVLDDGSTDGTGLVAAAEARCVRLAENRGKAAVVCEAVRQLGADIYVTLDADLSGYGPEDIRALIGPLLSDDGLSMTVARCNFNGAVPMDALAQESLLGVQDDLSGQRAYRAPVLEAALAFAEKVRARHTGFVFHHDLEQCANGVVLRDGLRVREIAFGANILNPTKDEKWGPGWEKRCEPEKEVLDREAYGKVLIRPWHPEFGALPRKPRNLGEYLEFSFFQDRPA